MTQWAPASSPQTTSLTSWSTRPAAQVGQEAQLRTATSLECPQRTPRPHTTNPTVFSCPLIQEGPFSGSFHLLPQAPSSILLILSCGTPSYNCHSLHRFQRCRRTGLLPRRLQCRIHKGERVSREGRGCPAHSRADAVANSFPSTDWPGGAGRTRKLLLARYVLLLPSLSAAS